MKFKTVTHYVEKSFEGKPSFVIVLQDLVTNKETSYISNGCQFVENTKENIQKLVIEYNCEQYIKELFNSPINSLDVIIDGRLMFNGCSSLQQFTSNLPNLENGSCMFNGCSSLKDLKM